MEIYTTIETKQQKQKNLHKKLNTINEEKKI